MTAFDSPAHTAPTQQWAQQRYPSVLDLEPSSGRRPRRRLSLLVALTLALLAASAVAVSGSLAIFTSAPTVGGNAFTTGTVVLGVNPATALLTSANMMPGDTVAGSLVVTNSGTGQLRYAMTSASTNAAPRA